MTQFFAQTSCFLAKSILVVLLASCAATPPHGGLPLTHAEESAQTSVQPLILPTPPTGLPNIVMTPDLLYQMLVAEIAGQRGQFQASSEAYAELAHSTRDRRLAERAAQIAVLSGDSVKTLAALRDWVELDPDNLDARQVLIAYLIRGGQPDEALPHLEKLVASARPIQPDPKSALTAAEIDFTASTKTATAEGPGFNLVTALLAREPNKQSSLSVMRKLVAAHSANADAQYGFALLAQNADDLPLALSAIDKTLSLQPGWPKAVVARARILLVQGENARALSYLKDTIEQYPDEATLRLSYARLLVDAKQPEDARQQFQAVARQSPDSAEVLLSLGLLSIQINQLDDARQYLLQAAALGKFSNETSYYLGQIAENKKQPDEAISWYKAVQQSEVYLDAQLRIVNLLSRKGDTDAALAQLRTIQVRDGREANLLSMAEADLLGDQKKYAEAMAIYNEALSTDPQDDNLLYGRAMLAASMDRIDILEQDLGAILSRDPNNARALNALGYTLADRTTRYAEALGYIKRALELNPQDPATLDSIGWVEYRMGNQQEALKHLRNAYELEPDAEIAAHLGEVLWVTGDREGARKVWQAAIQAAPQNEVLLATMKRLDVP